MQRSVKSDLPCRQCSPGNSGGFRSLRQLDRLVLQLLCTKDKPCPPIKGQGESDISIKLTYDTSQNLFINDISCDFSHSFYHLNLNGDDSYVHLAKALIFYIPRSLLG